MADLDFEIAEREFFSLLGPSGCGKTTTLRLIAGFELPSSGTVYIDGVDVSEVPPYLRNVNTVFQSYALFPHLNVGENVAFGLRRKKKSEDEVRKGVEEALELVRLSGFEDRPVTRLSGGQQQRVALARALVNQPKVLLLDEPLAALDSKLKRDVRRELKALQRQLGITFVLVTHDQEEALTLSDRVAVLIDGRMQQVSSPKELYHQPCNREVAEFIGDANFLPVKVEGEKVYYQEHQLNCEAPAESEHQTLMLRPEDLCLGPGEEGHNQLTGVLEETVFLGSYLRYHLRLEDGTPLVAEQFHRERSESEPGAAVTVSWSPSEGQLLK